MNPIVRFGDKSTITITSAAAVQVLDKGGTNNGLAIYNQGPASAYLTPRLSTDMGEVVAKLSPSSTLMITYTGQLFAFADSGSGVLNARYTYPSS